MLEAHGRGICCMGTTLHSMTRIAEFMALPDHGVPVTSGKLRALLETPGFLPSGG